MSMLDKIEYGMIAVGVTFSIANIEQILGLIMLIIQVLWLLIKLIVKIRNFIVEKKNLSELDPEVDKLLDAIGGHKDGTSKQKE